ncbi:hypothetical protein R6Q59_035314 [Mikania micrantha]
MARFPHHRVFNFQMAGYYASLLGRWDLEANYLGWLMGWWPWFYDLTHLFAHGWYGLKGGLGLLPMLYMKGKKSCGYLGIIVGTLSRLTQQKRDTLGLDIWVYLLNWCPCKGRGWSQHGLLYVDWCSIYTCIDSHAGLS